MDSKGQPTISVCIPTYDMHGVGHAYLKQSLDALTRQTYRDFDVVISDFSKTSEVREVVDQFASRLDIKYFVNQNPIEGISTNTNNAIRNAHGKLLKILFQDDYLSSERSLEDIVRNFDINKDRWLVTGCLHTSDGVTLADPHTPSWNDTVYLGNNTVGSPSVLTMKNDHPLFFDINLSWMSDCDYYQRHFEVFGPPKMISETATVIRTGEHQITNNEATTRRRNDEKKYSVRKYKARHSDRFLQLPTVTAVAVTGLNPAGAVKALRYSSCGVEFYESVLIARDRPKNLPPHITFKQCLVSDLQSKDRKNTNDYSKFIAYRLPEYIDSDFALIVHNDAYVLRPEKWDPRFLQYDYIGAPWPPEVHYTNEGVNVRVGNGGFSLRSRRLLNILNELNLPFTDNGTGYFHEDGIICVYYRKQLEDAGIRFAPPDIASKFSHEVTCQDSDAEPFGFHNTRSVIPKYFFLKQKVHSLFGMR